MCHSGVVGRWQTGVDAMPYLNYWETRARLDAGARAPLMVSLDCREDLHAVMVKL